MIIGNVEGLFLLTKNIAECEVITLFVVIGEMLSGEEELEWAWKNE